MPVLPDVLAPGLKVVFCGTAPGRKSAERKAYYAKAGNSFWQALYDVRLTPRLFHPEDYPSVTKLGLGLTDLAKHTFGSDAELKPSDFDAKGLRRKILKHKPCLLAFTSKNAGQAFLGSSCDYGLQPQTIGNTRLYVLCSPAGRARRFWDIAVWQRLADLVKETC
jgi:double-stranded uracil-DNA glycosylase